MTRVPATMEGVTDDSAAGSIKSDIETWMHSLPPAYREKDPDTQWDENYIYVPLQRRQLHAIGYMMMFLPFKSFLARTFDSKSSSTDRARRNSAIGIALHLMKSSHRLFDQVFPINAKFHLVTFLIFDTAAFLCSAIIHDKDRSLPQRDEVLRAISLACSLISQLAQVTKTGAICQPVIERLARSVSPKTATMINSANGDILNTGGDFDPLPELDALSHANSNSPEFLSSSLGLAPTMEMFFPASWDLPTTGMDTPPIMGVGDFSNLDVGQFDEIWDWQDLDLTLLPHLPK